MSGLLLDEIFSRDPKADTPTGLDQVRFVEIETHASFYDVLKATVLQDSARQYAHAQKIGRKYQTTTSEKFVLHRFMGIETPVMTHPTLQRVLPEVIAHMRLSTKAKELKMTGFPIGAIAGWVMCGARHA